MTDPLRNLHADRQTFRQWLVKQLTRTRWSLPIDSHLAEAAIELGVRIDVLKEALDARRARDLAGGRPLDRKRNLVEADFGIIEIAMPPAVEKDWKEYYKALQINPGALLRSVVNQFLLRPTRPRLTTDQWVYRRKRYKTRSEAYDKRYTTKARIPRGAVVAFDEHAHRYHVTPTALIRGLLTELLEGRVSGLKIVAYREMWADPDRYLHPEKFQA